MSCNETRGLLDAWMDNELDLRGSLEVEEHLGRCADCAAQERSLRQLQGSARANLTRHEVPAGLDARLRAALRSEAGASAGAPPARPRALRALRRAAPLLAASVAVIVAAGILRPSPERGLAESVIDAHVRSLLASHLTDVASSDQHTVKPWFQGKLDYSVQVTDFAAEGFPLSGGRLDYVEETPAAALVYRRGRHVINLFIWPQRKRGGESTVQHLSMRGYGAYRWSKDGMSYWAVSDLNDAELQEFVELVRRER
ncbi:MAG TPA: anti-sigma factor [Myxococcales bacterium]|nr:anti-sigma factor [Myxococcales bacterium]